MVYMWMECPISYNNKEQGFILSEKIQRSWFFATNSDFLIPISLKPNVVNLWYFKLILFDLTELIAWNVKGLRHWNLKI